ncbi:hypothetical protein CVT24_010399 [Panaeolus cyanescens]|uniref:Uncharacterized protein n=1 Tax=Panaeolus cyanescens TaxID=181874 RepID=A0A409WU00_9AGAR|nr:hypothetical protein CVT24_010399 [Panaeolus cyanescens]
MARTRHRKHPLPVRFPPCPEIMSALDSIWRIIFPKVVNVNWTPGTPFPASFDDVCDMFKRASPYLEVISQGIARRAREPPNMKNVLSWIFAFADLFPHHEGPASFLHTFKEYRLDLNKMSSYYPQNSNKYMYPSRPRVVCMQPTKQARSTIPNSSHFSASTQIPVKMTSPATPRTTSKRKLPMKLSTAADASTSKQGGNLPYDSEIEEIPPFTVTKGHGSKHQALYQDSDIEEIPPFTAKKRTKRRNLP